jgi:pyruvate dehydrogenase complex dehydrogenase (E1) component
MELTELEKFASDMEKNILKVDDLPEHKRAAYEDMKQEVITFSTKNSIKKYSKMLKELQEIFERSEVKNGLKVLDGHKGNLNDEEIERIDELGINFIEKGIYTNGKKKTGKTLRKQFLQKTDSCQQFIKNMICCQVALLFMN